MATYQKRGERWRVQVRLGGSKPLSKTFSSKKEATDWAKRVEGRLVDGVIVELRGAADRTTLGEALERYLLEVTPTKKGAKQERGRIRLLSRHHLADRPLSSITSTDIAEYRNDRQTAGKAPTTIRNALTIISQVYETAQIEWKMSGLVNPVSRIKMPKHRPGRDRRFVVGEEEALLQTCRSLDRPWVEPLVRLAIETAMRQGELLAFEARWVRDCVIQIPDSKTSSPRSVPLSSIALSILHAMPVPIDRGRFFTCNQDQVEYWFAKARRLAQLDDLKFHDLRHEATSRLFEKGLNPFEVMSVTGHKTTDMLKRYTHFGATQLLKKMG